MENIVMNKKEFKIHKNERLTQIEAVVFKEGEDFPLRCGVIVPETLYLDNKEILDTLTFKIDGVDRQLKILIKPKTLELQTFIKHAMLYNADTLTEDLIQGIGEATNIDIEFLTEFNRVTTKEIMSLHYKMTEVVSIYECVEIGELKLNVGDQVYIKRRMPNYVEIKLD